MTPLLELVFDGIYRSLVLVKNLLDATDQRVTTLERRSGRDRRIRYWRVR